MVIIELAMVTALSGSMRPFEYMLAKYSACFLTGPVGAIKINESNGVPTSFNPSIKPDLRNSGIILAYSLISLIGLAEIFIKS